MTKVLPALDKRFRLEEATIGELHAAINAGDTTCVAVVQTYIARVRAYNGVASALVTEEGAPVAPATGTVRAGTALRFPTETVKASTNTPGRRWNMGAWRRPPPIRACSSSSA
jgi:amidase